MIRYLEMFIMYSCFWSCGAVFSHTMERRKNFKRNATVLGIVFAILFLIPFPPPLLMRNA